MDIKEMFGDALWISAGIYGGRDTRIPDKNGVPYFPVIRRKFTIGDFDSAVLRIVGLGYFHCYINGTEITGNAFLPLATDYEERENYPEGEKLTGHRIYVPEFDVTPYLKKGENLLAVHFGGGWYSHDADDAFYGMAKVIYSLKVSDKDRIYNFVSSPSDKAGKSYVTEYSFTEYEVQDFTVSDESVFSPGYDDCGWKNAVPAKPVVTSYLFSDCPADIFQPDKKPVLINEKNGVRYYDTLKNCSQIPVIELAGKKGDRVEIIFSEEKNEDGTLNNDFFFGQKFILISDGKKRTAQPAFTWFSFRYLSIKGSGEIKCVKEIHSDVKIKSDFHCDNETLNWLYNAYVNTQLSNMHGGIPSDCPHLERRGYTGDGQLTCHAAMTVFDAQKFYKKWIYDISDCQDIYSGHVQYTAPYNRAGGGPGGWGCAIIELPYQYYKHYGDKSFLISMYPQMLSYLRYLDAHSGNGFVVSDKKNQWCLGEWCSPGGVKIPDAFVNNYFYIKSLMRLSEIASVIGKSSHIPYIEKKKEELKKITEDVYISKFSGSFFGGIEGADAFAADIGIGNESTYKNIINRYEALGSYDTGIFGTDILTRVLFEHGNADLSLKLLTSDSTFSFEEMRKEGATSLWENWPDDICSRSRNHPMFGAVCAYLFDYILGVRQEKGEAGYKKIIIAPVFPSQLNEVCGYVDLPGGRVSVSYKKDGERIDLTAVIPDKLPASFIYKDTVKILSAGENKISL